MTENRENRIGELLDEFAEELTELFPWGRMRAAILRLMQERHDEEKLLILDLLRTEIQYRLFSEKLQRAFAEKVGAATVAANTVLDNQRKKRTPPVAAKEDLE